MGTIESLVYLLALIVVVGGILIGAIDDKRRKRVGDKARTPFRK